jgi:hypothetical protein
MIFHRSMFPQRKLRRTSPDLPSSRPACATKGAIISLRIQEGKLSQAAYRDVVIVRKLENQRGFQVLPRR